MAACFYLPSSICVRATEFMHAHRLIVKVKEEAALNVRGATLQEMLGNLASQLKLPEGCALQESKLTRLHRRTGRRPAQSPPDLHRFLYLELPPGVDVEDCLRRLQQHPWIEYAEKDGIGRGGGIPDDPEFPSQWHHRNTISPGADIETPAAWDTTTGSRAVLVAVLDTGLAPALGEFENRIVTGYDFVNDDDDPADDHGHGTSVTGTLGATGNNGSLVAGVDWKCRIMPIKVLNSENVGYYSDWAEGVDFAVASGCKVINLSAGGSGTSTPLTQAIRGAVAQGVIFVTITHNHAGGTITYPGNLAETITVGATDEWDRRAGFSNYGPQIDLVAPGTNMWTVSRQGTAARWWGTSFAAPLVSGVCSLLAALDPEIDQEQARALLALGADDGIGEDGDTPGFDSFYGWGRLNAHHTLRLARTPLRLVGHRDRSDELWWPSPGNASEKRPFVVEWKNVWSDNWISAPATNGYRYTPDRTYWNSAPSPDRARYYRLRLRDL